MGNAVRVAHQGNKDVHVVVTALAADKVKRSLHGLPLYDRLAIEEFRSSRTNGLVLTPSDPAVYLKLLIQRTIQLVIE
jgi:hypothetical protein